MDLVSSALDKYLKHRFNGLERVPKMNGLTQNENNVDARCSFNDNNVSVKISDQTPPVNASSPSQSSATQGDATNSTRLCNNSSGTVNDPTICSNNHTDSVRMNNGIDAPITNDETYMVERQHTNSNHFKTSADPNSQHIMTNGIAANHYKMPKIYSLSIRVLQPCCLALNEDLQLLAAGFENSHIYLWSLKQDSFDVDANDTFALLAHSGPVYGLNFINDKDLMLSCSEDTTVRLWCLKTKCNLFVYRGHNYPIWSLDIGPQGTMFASASMDGTSRLWQFDRMTPLRIFCGHEDDVECVKFHPNEKYLATGSSDATVRLWSISDGKMVRLMVGHRKTIISLSFLPNGKFLASASNDGDIKIWDLATNSVTNEISVPPSFSISFSADHKFLSTCGVDNVLHLWRVEKSSKLIGEKSIDFRMQSSKIFQSQFHRDSKLIVIGHTAEGNKTEKKR